MSTSASRLKTLRTACSLPQRASNARVSAEPGSRAGASNARLVGMITIRVKGTTLPMRMPAASRLTTASGA